jgi:hypothetical protein
VASRLPHYQREHWPRKEYVRDFTWWEERRVVSQ